MAKPNPQAQSLPTTPPQLTGPQQVGVTEADLKHHLQELGALGKFFGSRDHAPINIAGLLVILGVLGMFGAPFLPMSNGFVAADMVKAMAALVVAAMTFLGGYLSGGKS